MMLYLDSCSLQRPLDNKSQIRIALESEAVLVIIALCEIGHIELVSSEALLFETERITNPYRREFALEILNKAKSFVQLDDTIKERARELNKSGIMALDALHIALAERAESDYFCTCDDKLLKKAKPLCEPKMKIVSPLQYLEEVENDSGS